MGKTWCQCSGRRRGMPDCSRHKTRTCLAASAPTPAAPIISSIQPPTHPLTRPCRSPTPSCPAALPPAPPRTWPTGPRCRWCWASAPSATRATACSPPFKSPWPTPSSSRRCEAVRVCASSSPVRGRIGHGVRGWGAVGMHRDEDSGMAATCRPLPFMDSYPHHSKPHCAWLQMPCI